MNQQHLLPTEQTPDPLTEQQVRQKTRGLVLQALVGLLLVSYSWIKVVQGVADDNNKNSQDSFNDGWSAGLFAASGTVLFCLAVRKFATEESQFGSCISIDSLCIKDVRQCMSITIAAAGTALLVYAFANATTDQKKLIEAGGICLTALVCICCCVGRIYIARQIDEANRFFEGQDIDRAGQ